MNTKQIICKLNNTETIKFEFSNIIHTFYQFDEVIVKFTHENYDYVLGIDFFKEEVESLYIPLTDAIDNKAQLHPSITQDIGYLWNEELQDKPGLAYNTSSEGEKFWVGLDNSVWSTPGTCKPKLNTWLYNDALGEIILEITPSYPWHFVDPTENEHYIPYEQWIKTYAPLVIRTMPRDIALVWKNQLQEIIAIIEKNEQHSTQVSFITNSKYKEYTKRAPFYPPQNGQEALNNSIAYSENSMERVGISDVNFVLLHCDCDARQAYKRKYHGHLKSWKSLEQNMKNALIHAGLVDQKGNFQCSM